MGVPSFYRWLVNKYPKIVQKAIEVPDACAIEPNPNGIEFDYLYLDMNCIVHPCFHPQDQLSQPKTYDDVFQSVFQYIDRIFSIVRPRKLLYMALDGVAPRAKMNNQRARRFRSAISAEIADIEEDKLRTGYERANKVLMPKEKNEVASSNVITPGTVFMEKLSKALEYYIRLRLKTDPAWMNIKVILSDANVPGEGEHKIMTFIRAQRDAHGYNPNLRHCLYGLDADLIMLGLATHEIHFFILREDVSLQNQNTVLPSFDQGLHEMVKTREWYKRLVQQNENMTPSKKPFEFLSICILREYLELDMTIQEFKVEIDRLVDDFIFICFFMGNDFLPNIPSLEAHESAMDLLIEVYRRMLKKSEGYLIDTAKMKDKKHAYIKISRVLKFIIELGTYEEKIFIKRNNIRKKKLHMFSQELSAGDMGHTCFNDLEVGTTVIEHNSSCTSSGSTGNNELDVLNNTSELQRRLNEILKKQQDTYETKKFSDKTRLGEPGWKHRYYKEKFHAEDSSEIERTQKIVVEKYMEGLCWVLQYYFVGVCSWTWYYPYYYGPFASDMKNLSCAKVNFKVGQPLNPLDQLMAVLPPQSSDELPRSYAELMNCKDSPISKFYPRGDTEIDMDGKRFLWQGIMKLPFIDEELLLASTKLLESQLQVTEVERNSLRNDKIFVRSDTVLGSKLAHSSGDLNLLVDFQSCELSGVLISRKGLDEVAFFSSPMHCMDDIKDDNVVSAEYLTSVVGVPVLRLLENVDVPQKVITVNDVPQRELWHLSSAFRQKTNTKHGSSHQPDYRKNKASSSHAHETWKCAGSGWVGAMGRGYSNDNHSSGSRSFTRNQGRGYARGRGSVYPGESSVVYTASSGSNRGSGGDRARIGISPGGSALDRGTDGDSDGWQVVGPRHSRVGRGRARN